MRALLFSRDLEPRTRGGVQQLLNLHFVRTGEFPPEISRQIARLQKYREEADYAHAFVVDTPGALEEIEAADELIGRIRELLST